MKISINKEFNELKTMIKEEIGENKNYYRISLIAELIEKDVKVIIEQLHRTIKIQEDLKEKMEETTNYTEELLSECKNLQEDLTDVIKKDKGIDLEKMIEIKDPVSEIVKDVNTLNNDQQELLMHYIKGFAVSAKQDKIIKSKI